VKPPTAKRKAPPAAAKPKTPRRAVKRKASPSTPKRKGGPVPGTPSPMRTRMTPELQAHVKRLYETTDQPVCQIALDVGVNESVIRRMGPREGWVRFVAPPCDLPPVTTLLAEVEELEKAVLAQPPTDSRCSASAFLSGSTAAEGRLCPSPPLATLAGGGEQEGTAASNENIERFIQVVMAHLDEFEAVRRAGKLIARQHLPTARAISILTEAFNKLQRLRAAQPGQNHDDIADMPADLDEYRLELTRRIREFLRSRVAGRDGGGAAAPAVEGA
jgi:transposase-like protein